MHSKVMILLWERWKVTRWLLILSCLLPLLGRLMYLTGFTSLESSTFLSKFFWYIGFCWLTLVLFMGHCEAQDLKLSFPERLFRYPVRTRTLLLVYMGYGVMVIAIQAIIFLGFEKLFFDPINFKWSYLLILEITYIIVQTIAWLSWIPRAGLRFLLLIPSYGIMSFSLFYFFRGGLNFSMGITILYIIIIFICCMISLLSVSAHRHKTWEFNWKWIDRSFTIFRRRPSKPFASPLQAQIWFELRQTGHLFLIAFLMLIGMLLISVLVYCSVMWIRYEKFLFMPMSNLITLIVPLTILAALIAGLFAFAVYHHDHNSGVSGFWLRRPLSTRKMAVARLNATMLSIARVFGIIILITFVLIIFDWNSDKLDIKALTPVKWALKYSSPLEIITMTILGLYGYVLFCWTVLYISAELLSVAVIAILITGFTRLLFGETAADYVMTVLCAGVPVGVLIAFYIARRRNLVTSTTLVITVCIFPLAVIFLWAYPWFYSITGLPKGLPDLSQVQIIRLIAVATLPFIPVATTPLLMDKLRHR